MSTIIGFIIIASIALGVYVGGWVMFIGGIVDVIEAAKATPVDALVIAVGLLKVVLASTVGTLLTLAGVGLGGSIME